MSSLLSIQNIASALTSRAPRSLDLGDVKRAAVAAVFRERAGDAELLFIQRAAQPNDPWSGQIAFPGGREEPGDPDLVGTAARETREELGLDLPAHAAHLGPLDPLQARSRRKIRPLVIHPFAWMMETETPPMHAVPNAEVASAFWFPVRALADPGRQLWYDAFRTEVPMRFPAIDLGDDRVLWGLTHRMVVEMGSRLGFIDPEQVDALTTPRGS